MLPRGDEGIFHASEGRQRQVNKAVAEAAERWIYHHPDDDPLRGLSLAPPMRFVDEIVGVILDGDYVREQHRLVKRPARDGLDARLPTHPGARFRIPGVHRPDRPA